MLNLSHIVSLVIRVSTKREDPAAEPVKNSFRFFFLLLILSSYFIDACSSCTNKYIG